MVNTLFNSILGGIMISIGGCVYLSAGNPIIGSFLFSVGLLVILALNLKLYTGAIGYAGESVSIVELFAIYAGNTIGTAIVGSIVYEYIPKIHIAAEILFQDKLHLLLNTSFHGTTFFLAVFCGILMYVAVDTWKNCKNDFARVIVPIFAVSTFILCRFEHVIADLFYIFAAKGFSLDIFYNKFLFIDIVLIGNTVGSIMFHRLRKLWLTTE